MNKWIQKAKPKKGALSRQLGIPMQKKIPMQLLNRIVAARSGQVIRNPTSKGKRMITVTRTMERRAIMARNLKRIRR